MSTAPGFFQSEAVRALLGRAGRAGGVPIAIHFVMDRHEGPRITGHGGCAACQHVSGISGGKAACRQSRSAVSARALRQARAIADTCHLGFGILALPALAGEGYALTLGPFVTAGEDGALAHLGALEHDALQGLADITGELLPAFPVPLGDIHRAPGGSMPALAEWIAEELARLWALWLKEAREDAQPPEAEALPARPSRKREPVPIAVALATAIAGTNRKRVRALLGDHLAELPGRATGPGTAAAHMLAVLTQALGTCAGAGIGTGPAMALLPQAAVALPKAKDDRARVEIAYRVLASLMRDPKKQFTPTLLAYRGLDRLVCDNLPDGIELEALGEALGKDPTTITRHLQRHFGLNYSGYVAVIRVERAKRLLRETRLPATVIGIRVGIDDQSNFTKAFRLYTGMTPLAYRQKFAKAAPKAPK